jgi:hypothetical protein
LERRLLQHVFLVLLESILLPDQVVVLPVLLGHINRIRTKRRATHAQLVLIHYLVQAVVQVVMLGLILLQVLQVAQRVSLEPIRILEPRLVLHAGLDLTILHQDRRPVHLALQALPL